MNMSSEKDDDDAMVDLTDRHKLASPEKRKLFSIFFFAHNVENIRDTIDRRSSKKKMGYV